uniref:GPI transamidase component PIG-T n=1 Tax=Odontella aurita TaxID=265563 RepID=A0A7S4J5R5_9STRA
MATLASSTDAHPGDSRHGYRERAVVSLRRHGSGDGAEALIADVVLESHSALHLNLAVGSADAEGAGNGARRRKTVRDALDEAAFPFPKDRVNSLLLGPSGRETGGGGAGVSRVLLRAHSSPSGGGADWTAAAAVPWPADSGNGDGDGIFAQEDGRDDVGPSWRPGPVGTSVYARFSSPTSPSAPIPPPDRVVVAEQSRDPRGTLRFHSLLRSLSGSRLSCSPLDSLLTPKHGHRPARLSPDEEEFEATLPSEGGSFCVESLRAIRDLDGCRGRAGLFAGLADGGVGGAADLLLGRDEKSVVGGGRGAWIDLAASDGCHRRGGGNCTLAVRRGVRYSVRVDGRTAGGGATKAELSLADVLLGSRAAKTKKKTIQACPLATSSVVQTVLHVDGGVAERAAADFRLPPSSRDVTEGRDGGRRAVAVHDLQSLGDVDLTARWLTAKFPPASRKGSSSGGRTTSPSSADPWGVERTISRPRGVANAGTIHTSYRFGSSLGLETCKRARVRTLDVLPDLFRPVLHTVRVGVYEGGGAGHADFVPGSGMEGTEARELSLPDLRSHGIAPTLTFGSPGDGSSVRIELDLELGRDSSLWLSVDYEPVYLAFESFPSDPNRGMDLAPSVGRFTCVDPPPIATSAGGFNSTLPSGGNSYARVYSPPLLLMPPVPDMSMPFNVISLTCTLYAFVIGSMVNFLVRKSTQSVKDAFEGKKEKTKLEKIKEKLRNKLGRFLPKRRRGEDGEGKEGKDDKEQGKVKDKEAKDCEKEENVGDDSHGDGEKNEAQTTADEKVKESPK